MMRIITGKARGIRLATLDGEATRPTTERVKEAVFSMIQFDIEGREVLDLFSGSGQLALEALSRGASHAVLVDRSKDAVKIIRTNAAKTKLDSLCNIYNCEYSDYILKNKGKKFDLIFLDPPYALGLCADALEKLVTADMLKTSTVIVCETGSDDVFGTEKDLAACFEVIKHVRYSHSYVTILSPRKDVE